MDDLELKKIMETLLFITDEPLTAERISKICDIDDVKYINEKLEELKHNYDLEGRALQIMKVAGGWQMSTRPEYGIWIRKLYQTRLTLRLSNAALEVLSIVAFKQQVTKAEIEAIRGVDSSGPIDTLIERKLITNVGRKETLGRPIMYGTTDEFLKQFGLNSLADLPNLDGLVSTEAIAEVNTRLLELNENQPVESQTIVEDITPSNNVEDN